MKDAIEELTFQPYVVYKSSVKSIERFYQMSRASYYVTHDLIINKEGDNPNVTIDFDHILENFPEVLSFSAEEMEHIGIKKGFPIEITSYWITLAEYAEKKSLPLEQVIVDAKAGNLGHVLQNPETGEDIVIWPETLQDKSLNELPSPGELGMSMKITYEVIQKLIEREQAANINNLLYLAKSLQDQEVYEEVNNNLAQACFLLQWVFFEVFIKATIHQLYSMHPLLVSSGREKNQTLTYDELVAYSDRFTSLNHLQQSIVQKEITRQEENGKSVTSLIEFLKSKIKFQQDPFEVPYMLRGKITNCKYSSLEEVREVRNTLVHDGGIPRKQLLEKYPYLRLSQGKIFINDEYYSLCRLILQSISYSIASSIERKLYTIKV